MLRRRGLTVAGVAALSCVLLVAGVALTGGGDGSAPRAGASERQTEAHESPTTDPSPTALPRPTAPPDSQPLGLKWSWAQPDTFGFVATAAGGSTFVEVLWCDVEPQPGTYDWGALDGVVRDARLLGHQPMLKLRAGECWGTEPPSAEGRDLTESTEKDASTPPSDLAAYLSFVRTVVGRYAARGIDVYAIENEPDTVNHWAASLDSYRATAEAVAGAIHEVHPAAHVLDGGPSSTSYGVALAAATIDTAPDQALQTYRAYYARRLAGSESRFPDVGTVDELRTVLRTEGALRAVQTVGIALELANSGVTDGYQLHFYEQASQLPDVLTFLRERLRGGVPVEAWEIGSAWPGPGYDDTAHAEEVYRLVGLLLEAGVAPIVYLPAAYSPAPGKAQVFRGLVEPDGTAMPAGTGWEALTAALSGLHELPVWPAREGLAGATWQIGRRQAALVWATGDPVALDESDVELVVDATGSTVPAPPVVGSRPVLVLGSANGDLARQLGRD